MFYDAYYDFGIVGVFIFAVIVGAVAKVLMSIVKKSQNPVSYLFYGQIAIYLGLAFYHLVQQSYDLVLADSYRNDVLVCRIR